MTILGILVTRSVRRRRQRNGAFLAALASGTPSVRRGNNGVPEKPVLWESLITSVDDEGKGWAGIGAAFLQFAYYNLYPEGVCHGQPVAGVTSVPVHEAKSQRPSAFRQPRPRFPPVGTRHPIAPNSPNSTALPLESPVPSSNPVYLTVLVSMPMPRAHEDAKQVKGSGGPPIVELGVAEVTCTQNDT